jgi:hypothetical protein
MPDKPTILDCAAAAGYWQRLDMPRLLADVRKYPCCGDLKPRTFRNYLTGRTRMPFVVGIALSNLLGVCIDDLGDVK